MRNAGAAGMGPTIMLLRGECTASNPGKTLTKGNKLQLVAVQC